MEIHFLSTCFKSLCFRKFYNYILPMLNHWRVISHLFLARKKILGLLLPLLSNLPLFSCPLLPLVTRGFHGYFFLNLPALSS